MISVMMICQNEDCKKECYHSRSHYDPVTNTVIHSCNHCDSRAVTLPDLRDQTEFLIHQNHIGSTRSKMIENHRRDATLTERQIGWDGKTTSEQRRKKSIDRKRYAR